MFSEHRQKGEMQQMPSLEQMQHHLPSLQPYVMPWAGVVNVMSPKQDPLVE